jgi:hypothetical protein
VTSRAAAAYFNYFGAVAGTPGKGWYAYDLGTSRMYALPAHRGQDPWRVEADSELVGYEWEFVAANDDTFTAQRRLPLSRRRGLTERRPSQSRNAQEEDGT